MTLSSGLLTAGPNLICLQGACKVDWKELVENREGEKERGIVQPLPLAPLPQRICVFCTTAAAQALVSFQQHVPAAAEAEQTNKPAPKHAHACSKLLEEIPNRATSAPPHLQDGRWPGVSASGGGSTAEGNAELCLLRACVCACVCACECVCACMRVCVLQAG
jgi:hypothetical protein